MRKKTNSLRNTLPFPLTAGLLAFLSLVVPAHADLVVSFSPLGNVNAGSTGNSFDVLLTNSGPGAVDLGVFTFEVTTSSSDITLTDATINTTVAPYIFSGNSLIGPDILGATTGQDLTAFDLYAGAGDVTVGSGVTVGLGHVLFDVSPSATTGTVNLALASNGSSFATLSGVDVPIQTLMSGIVQTTGTVSPVPEPSTLILFVTFLGLASGWRLKAGLGRLRAAAPGK